MAEVPDYDVCGLLTYSGHQRRREAAEWCDPFDVPAHLIPEGMVFQWCAKRADSTGDRERDYEKMIDAGWVLVPPQWVPGWRNMIAGNDLMCRPKWMNQTATEMKECLAILTNIKDNS